MEKDVEDVLKGLQDKIRVRRSVKENVNYLKVPKGDYIEAAKRLKEHGFLRLLTVSAVDWIEKGTLEVYFLVHKLDENVYVKVATDIPRGNSEISSLSELWPNATMHERETWELFGIIFKGNETLEPLFLEDWDGPPPFRKDFDCKEYVKKNYNLPQAEME